MKKNKNLIFFEWFRNLSFFAKRVNILFVDSERAEIKEILLSNPPKIVNSYTGNLIDAVKKIKAKKIRLLLADNMAYCVRFRIPKYIQGNEERTYVFRRLVEIIPEELIDSDWDYKEQNYLNDEEKEVLAFAVVKEKFDLLRRNLINLKLDVEAIEPTVISKSRNEDPFIGLALKNDLSGKDNSTLNLKLNTT